MISKQDGSESLEVIEKIIAFENWAFGEIQRTPYSPDTVEEWNKRHGHRVPLDSSLPSQRHLEKMFDLYLKEKGVDLRE